MGLLMRSVLAGVLVTLLVGCAGDAPVLECTALPSIARPLLPGLTAEDLEKVIGGHQDWLRDAHAR